MPAFEELDYRPTPLGPLELRRRRASDGTELYEVKLGGAFLMSSLNRVSEEALATEALARLDAGSPRVLVGGLGLGYTAAAALADPRTGRVVVLEVLPEVIGWFRAGIVPLARDLVSDARCELRAADFFAFAQSPPEQPWDAVLVDIDHSPHHHLDADHAGFYTEAGLRAVREHLRPGGIFGLWSAIAPDPDFAALLARVFDAVEALPVPFHNLLLAEEEVNSVYLARRGS